MACAARPSSQHHRHRVKGVASIVDEGRITELPGVDRVIRITEKYKDAARSFHNETRRSVGGRVPVGGGNLLLRRSVRH